MEQKQNNTQEPEVALESSKRMKKRRRVHISICLQVWDMINPKWKRHGIAWINL